MAMNDRDKLFAQVQKMYGNDVIIVHSGKVFDIDQGFFMTESSNKPAKTRRELQKLLDHWPD